MRISRVDLTAFGHFTDHAIDLAPGARMHVLYGPNAAGKSTLGDAITYALFGWPAARSANPYAFEHASAKLRIGLALTTATGDEVRFQRRKGNGVTVVDPGTGANDEQLAGRVRALLRGVTRDQWQHRYALTSERLRAGGAAIHESGGDAERVLAAAQDGSGALHAVLDRIAAQRAAIQNDKRSGALVDAVKAFDAARAEVARGASTAASYEADVSRRGELDRELERASGERVEARVEHSQLVHARDAAADLARWAELDGQVRELAGAAGAWTRADHDAYAEAVRGRDAAVRNLVESTGRIEQARAALEDAASRRDEDLLARGDEITALQQRVGQVREARTSLEVLAAEVVSAKAALDRARVDAGTDADVDAGQRAAVREALDALSHAIGIETAAQARVDAARADRDEAAALVTALGGDDSVDEAFNAAVADAARIDTKALRERELQLDRALRDLEARAVALGHGLDLVSVRTIALPNVADEAAIADRMKVLDERCAEYEGIRANARAHLPKHQRELAELEAEGALPDPAELVRVRARRDEAWRVVRDGVTGAAPSASTITDASRSVDAVERGLREGDQLADQLVAAGERAGSAARIRVLIADDERRIEDATAEIERLTAERAQIERGAWTDLWRVAGVAAGSVAAMAQLRVDIEDLRTEARAHDERRARLDAELTAVADVDARLAGVLGETPEGASIDAFERRRGIAAERQRDRAARREKCAGAAATADARERTLAQAHGELEGAQDACGTARARLAAAATAARLDADERPAVLAVRVEALDRAASARAQLAASTQQQDAARTLVESFTRDALALSIDADRDLPAERIVERAAARVEGARTARTEHRNAASSISELEAQHASLEADRAAAEEQLSRLQQAAQVDRVDDLAALDAAWCKCDVLAEQRHEIDRALLERTQLTAAKLAALRGDDDPAALAVRIEHAAERVDACAARFERLREERDALVASITHAERSQDAARAGQAEDQALVQIATLVPRLRRLAIQEQLLRTFLERRQRATRGPLVERASEYFARITLGAFERMDVERSTKGDNEVLVAVRARSGERLDDDAMSEGTRDQLYLALRLAALALEAEAGAETMPLVVDDVLMSADDDRARAILAIFDEISAHTQVLVLTHHRHLVELVRSTVADAEVLDVAPTPVLA